MLPPNSSREKRKESFLSLIHISWKGFDLALDFSGAGMSTWNPSLIQKIPFNNNGDVYKRQAPCSQAALIDENGSPVYLTPKMDKQEDRKSTRLNSSHVKRSRMPSSA